MLSWFKKKTLSPVSTPREAVSEGNAPASQFSWDQDAYLSVRFLLGMYVKKVPPFSEWLLPEAVFTPDALSTAEICVHSFQLTLWLWKFGSRFGAIAGKMARDTLFLTADQLDSENNFADMLEWLLDMHEDAYKVYSEMPTEQRQVTLNGQIVKLPREYFLALYFFTKLEGSPYYGQDDINNDDAFALAECLARASEAANRIFDPMQAAIVKFDPAAFAKWRWSKKPGSYEMHLMRRYNNPLFSPERQIVTGADVYAARVRDAELWNEVVGEATTIRQELQANELPPDWTEFLAGYRERIDACMEKASRLGSDSKVLEDYLQQSRDFITDIWTGAYKDYPEKLITYGEAEQLHYRRRATMFGSEWLRQLGNPERIVPAEEVLPAFLSEDIEQIKLNLQIFEAEPGFRQTLMQLRTGAIELVKPLLATGQPLPGIQEKLEVLGVAI